MFFEKLFNLLDIIHLNRILNQIKKYNLINLIDVGSHKGEFLSFMIKNKNIKNFYAFEPQKGPFSILTKKFLKNKNVKLFNLALSDKKEKKIFFVGKLTGTSTFEKLNTNSNYLKIKKFLLDTKLPYEKKICIQSDKIDNVFSKINLDRSILKIDVEGHEFNVLKGAKKKIKSISYLLVENHYLNLYKKNKKNQKVDFMKKNNFVIVKKFRHPLLIFEDILYRNLKNTN